MKRFAIFLVSLVLVAVSPAVSQESLSRLADPLTGTSNSRWMLGPYACVPFGMVQLGPDNQSSGWMNGYEYSISNVSGFSHIHAWTMGGLMIMPAAQDLTLTDGAVDRPYRGAGAGYHSRVIKETEKASPGYYSVDLYDAYMKAEMTATTRCGFFRFTAQKDYAYRVLADLAFPSEYNFKLDSSKITRVSDTQIEGFAKCHVSAWNQYTLYFVVRFNKPFTSFKEWTSENNDDAGAYMSWNLKKGETLLTQTGISLVDLDGARNNLKSEMDGFNWDFDKALASAESQWESLFSRIRVEGGKAENRRKFYTNFYRSFCAKQTWNDVDGRYTDPKEVVRKLPKGASIYGGDAFWNSFWNLNGLWSLVSPEIVNNWVITELELFNSTGWTSNGPTGLEMSGIMEVSHEIALMVGAWQKGIRNYDPELMYKAIKHTVDVQGGRLKPYSGPAGNEFQDIYKRLGYVPYEVGPACQTLDYAFNDYCVAQMAKALGKNADYDFYLKRSENWRNLFHPDLKWAVPRDSSGKWLADYSPFSAKYWIEGNGWEYSFYVPHNVPGLVNAMGRDLFNKRLEEGFEKSRQFSFAAHALDRTEGQTAEFYVNHGNEVNMQAAWLFNFSGKPWLAQKYVREIMDSYYGSDPYHGWEGDEDEGQMGAWYVMSALGLFSMDGGTSPDPVFELGTPLFDKITIQLDEKYYSGRTFTIETKNLSPESFYIQSVTLNGKKLDKLQLRFADIIKGGSLVVETGTNTGSVLQTNFSVTSDELKQGFNNPTPESRLRCYWWWLNSMATKESITRDLEEMKAKGYGGASLVDAGSSNYQVALKTQAGPVFMSPQWMELYRHAVREADRLGIELSVNVQSGWNPGAPSITPEFAMKRITWSEIDVAGGRAINMELPQPEQELFYKDIMVQAIKKVKDAPVQNDAIKYWKKKSFYEPMGWKGIYPLIQLREDYPGDGAEMAVKRDQIIDLTRNYQNGRLNWTAPPGDWTIIRYGYTCTGARTSTNSDGWEGLSVDHLSAEAFGLFSKTVIIPLIETAQSAGNSVKFLQTDSWEMGSVNWTAKFPDEFRKFRGYDMQEFMPVLAGRIVENREVTNRFLHDFRQTVGDCVAENHYRLFANLAHQYGLGIHPESGGPHSAPVDGLRVMGISDFPQGEFWAVSNTHRIKDDERLSVRQSASVAHTYGKRFVAAEGPTSIGPQWERSPKDLKGNIDRIFCSGVNRIVWHTFTSSPKEFGLPGNEYFAGTHLNPNVTWWKQSVDFISYLNRCSFMLQQGLFAADVLCYYGDDVPNYVFLKEDLPELNFGYDWDKCSKEVMLNRVSFQQGKIVLPDGMSYRLLMLPPEKIIDLAVLRKIELLVNAGMTVVGPRPDRPGSLIGYPENDRELKAIADRLWGSINGSDITENRVGNGRVVWGRNINQILASMDISPDFSFTSKREDAALDFIHRSTATEEIYFIANRFSRRGINDFQYRYLPGLPDRYEQVEAAFRVQGKVPQLWDPMTGQVKDIPDYREESGKTIIPLELGPEGSVFVVFTNAPAQKHRVAMRERAQTNKEVIEKPISGIWQIHFDPKWGGPETVDTDVLKSWSDFTDPGIRYYSGTATYTKTFDLKKSELAGRRIILDLGNVQEMASITVNGHRMPVVWIAPYLFDITDYVLPGKNNLEVEVVNMWPNRLIGDGKLPENQRYTKTNVIKFNSPDAEKYLRESGLLGPVKVKLIPDVRIGNANQLR